MRSVVVVAGLSSPQLRALESHTIVEIGDPSNLEFALAREPVQAVVIAADRDVDEICRHLSRCAERLRDLGATGIVVSATDVERVERALDGAGHYICPGELQPSSSPPS